jgi:hypothetical protein
MDLFQRHHLAFKPSTESISAMMMLNYCSGKREMIKALPEEERRSMKQLLPQLIVGHLKLLKETDGRNSWAAVSWVGCMVDACDSASSARTPSL